MSVLFILFTYKRFVIRMKISTRFAFVNFLNSVHLQGNLSLKIFTAEFNATVTKHKSTVTIRLHINIEH